jgi:hypothetical protein
VTREDAGDAAGRNWYLLLHHLPPEPLYLRAKVHRLLARAGAVPVKNAVYALPTEPGAREALESAAAAARAGGGQAYVCRAFFLTAKADEELVERSRGAREADYSALAGELARLEAEWGRPGARRSTARLARLRRRLAAIARIDFFHAPGGEGLQKRILRLERQREVAPARRGRSTADRPVPSELLGRTWVTRKGVAVDRIASAWLVRRYVDPRAKFRFVSGPEPRRENELRFDMPEGDVTHEGDRCTFETLLARTGLTDGALREIAQIVHDVDVKDGKFGRPEAAGVDRLVSGILVSEADDERRLERGFALFDELDSAFRAGRSGRRGTVRPPTASID